MNASVSSVMPDGGKARRVYLLLRDEITSGRLATGTLLPGEQRLAVEHGVSRVTIRRALEALSADGLIEKRVGSGSKVIHGKTEAPVAADFSTLIPQVAAMGTETKARLLAFSYGPAPGSVARAMGVALTARMQCAVRVRMVGGTPFSHLTTHVPEAIATGYDEADLATTPLFRLLERSGVKVGAAEQSLSATLAAPEVAEALNVAVGSALLSLTRVVRDADGHAVEHLSALYRPDMFRMEMTLSRVGDPDSRHWEPVIGRSSGEDTVDQGAA